jgi:uncharacterized membrane protein YcaP (DUF421 family)
MRREFMTDEEIASLRLQGGDEVADVEHARLEPNGMINVQRRDRQETESVEFPPVL